MKRRKRASLEDIKPYLSQEQWEQLNELLRLYQIDMANHWVEFAYYPDLKNLYFWIKHRNFRRKDLVRFEGLSNFLATEQGITLGDLWLEKFINARVIKDIVT